MRKIETLGGGEDTRELSMRDHTVEQYNTAQIPFSIP